MTNQLTHTPGPYRIAHYEHEDGSKTIYIKDEPIGLLLAEICKGVDNEEGNANLFVAAPDLLAACEMALKTLWFERDRATLENEVKAIEMLQAAIEKARGQAEGGKNQ